jgi:hypothetical protein
LSGGDPGPGKLIERARGGDWDAIEDLVSGAIAPTFDAALHLFGDPAKAAQAAEDALLAMLAAVRAGSVQEGGDPLAATATSLAAAARASGIVPFAAGLSAGDLVALGLRPDDGRRGEIAKLAASDRVAAVLTFALDLPPDALAAPLGATPAAIAGSLARILDAIPHEDPAQAFRDILDARAAQVRLPAGLEDRVLDRFEQG